MAKKTSPAMILGGLGLLGGLAILMGAKAQDDETPLPKPPGPDETPSPSPTPPPPPKPDGKGVHPGAPPRGDSYDGDYWGSTSEERLRTIRQYFADFGYPVEVGPWAMNDLGPLGVGKMLKNFDGDEGRVGGGDDKPAPLVGDFQKDYNAVSWYNDQAKVLPFKMGGLAEDEYVGPKTLNALRSIRDHIGDAGVSWEQLVDDANAAGFAS